MAVESTPERSFSDLFSSSRAARGDHRVRPVPEVRRRHHGAQRRSIGRLGSERKFATPASVLSASA